ncbi:MAG: hypothetical protein IPL24_08130 [Bacteroidetes bacterium]|nr:hypothetical protein [Bacteroidota bacterium]
MKSVETGIDVEQFKDIHKMLMDKFPAEKYDVMGFSLGGRVALTFISSCQRTLIV